MDSSLQEQQLQILSPCNSVRRRSSDSNNSPDFEFWMVRNPSLPQQELLSADELFVNGVLLPLDLLPQHQQYRKTEEEEEENQQLEEEEERQQHRELSSLTAETSPLLTSSKRWRDIIFKKNDKKTITSNTNNHEDKEKDKRKEKKSHVGTTSSSSAELNINIWPFSRSRSAGNNTTRPRTSTSRKVSSAPCSRSNSAGESKSRKWPSSPGRAGVHLGRTSPVWQVRRGNTSGPKNSESVTKNAEKGVKKSSGNQKPKVLNLKVPMCIGYRHQLSCRSDENSALGIVGNSGKSSSSNSENGGGGGNNVFSLRSIFTKKVY